MSQACIGSFNTVREVGDGEFDLPSHVGGYELVDSHNAALYRAPATIDERRVAGEIVEIQEFLWVKVSGTVDRVTLSHSYREGRRREVKLFEESDEKTALEAAVEWMKENPAPADPETVDRPGIIQRPRTSRRDMDDEAEATRVGTTVTIDSLMPSVVIEDLTEDNEDDDQDDGLHKKPQGPEKWESNKWLCETPAGEQFRLYHKDSFGVYGLIAYEPPTEPNAGFRCPDHFETDNEENLRESVAAEAYEWLGEREGENVIIEGTGEGDLFEVKKVKRLRDGFLNPPPTSGALDPDSRRSRGTYVDADLADRLYECPVDLSTGNYRVTEQGVVESRDKYAVDIVVPASTWDEKAALYPTSEATETLNAEVDNPLYRETTPVDTEATVDDITGVGESTFEKVWVENIDELYAHGWPLPFVSGQYMSRAIAQMFTVPEDGPDRSSAIRAVVGMLGGVAFGEDGERLGTTASCITGELTVEDATTGWLANTARIKNDYCPSWSGRDGDVSAFGAGEISVEQIEEVLADDATRKPATKLTTSVDDSKKVALSTASDDIEERSYVALPERVLEIAGTIARFEMDDTEQRATNITYWDEPGEAGEGVIHINGADEWNVVIDTSDRVRPEEVCAAAETGDDEQAVAEPTPYPEEPTVQEESSGA